MYRPRHQNSVNSHRSLTGTGGMTPLPRAPSYQQPSTSNIPRAANLGYAARLPPYVADPQAQRRTYGQVQENARLAGLDRAVLGAQRLQQRLQTRFQSPIRITVSESNNNQSANALPSIDSVYHAIENTIESFIIREKLNSTNKAISSDKECLKRRRNSIGNQNGADVSRSTPASDANFSVVGKSPAVKPPWYSKPSDLISDGGRAATNPSLNKSSHINTEPSASELATTANNTARQTLVPANSYIPTPTNINDQSNVARVNSLTNLRYNSNYNYKQSDAFLPSHNSASVAQHNNILNNTSSCNAVRNPLSPESNILPPAVVTQPPAGTSRGTTSSSDASGMTISPDEWIEDLDVAARVYVAYKLIEPFRDFEKKFLEGLKSKINNSRVRREISSDVSPLPVVVDLTEESDAAPEPKAGTSSPFVPELIRHLEIPASNVKSRASRQTSLDGNTITICSEKGTCVLNASGDFTNKDISGNLNRRPSTCSNVERAVDSNSRDSKLSVKVNSLVSNFSTPELVVAESNVSKNSGCGKSDEMSNKRADVILTKTKGDKPDKAPSKIHKKSARRDESKRSDKSSSRSEKSKKIDRCKNPSKNSSGKCRKVEREINKVVNSSRDLKNGSTEYDASEKLITPRKSEEVYKNNYTVIHGASLKYLNVSETDPTNSVINQTLESITAVDLEKPNCPTVPSKVLREFDMFQPKKLFKRPRSTFRKRFKLKPCYVKLRRLTRTELVKYNVSQQDMALALSTYSNNRVKSANNINEISSSPTKTSDSSSDTYTSSPQKFLSSNSSVQPFRSTSFDCNAPETKLNVTGSNEILPVERKPLISDRDISHSSSVTPPDETSSHSNSLITQSNNDHKSVKRRANAIENEGPLLTTSKRQYMDRDDQKISGSDDSCAVKTNGAETVMDRATVIVEGNKTMVKNAGGNGSSPSSKKKTCLNNTINSLKHKHSSVRHAKAKLTVKSINEINATPKLGTKTSNSQKHHDKSNLSQRPVSSVGLISLHHGKSHLSYEINATSKLDTKTSNSQKAELKSYLSQSESRKSPAVTKYTQLKLINKGERRDGFDPKKNSAFSKHSPNKCDDAKTDCSSGAISDRVNSPSVGICDGNPSITNDERNYKVTINPKQNSCTNESYKTVNQTKQLKNNLLNSMLDGELKGSESEISIHKVCNKTVQDRATGESKSNDIFKRTVTERPISNSIPSSVELKTAAIANRPTDSLQTQSVPSTFPSSPSQKNFAAKTADKPSSGLGQINFAMSLSQNKKVYNCNVQNRRKSVEVVEISTVKTDRSSCNAVQMDSGHAGQGDNGHVQPRAISATSNIENDPRRRSSIYCGYRRSSHEEASVVTATQRFIRKHIDLKLPAFEGYFCYKCKDPFVSINEWSNHMCIYKP